MSPNIDEQNVLLGFLTLQETLNKDGYIGSIMITDIRGVPQEFRCTHPVKPTVIQKPLYGDTLEPYIGVNLCGIPLIRSVDIKPSLIVVNKEFLLDVRTTNSPPIVLVRRAGEVIEINTSDTTESKLKRERLDSLTGRFQPIVFTSHPDFANDMEIARHIFEETFSYFDPIEPFDRISKAMGILAKQDSKFQ